MSIAFKKNCSLILIFSNDLTKIILQEKNGKFDGFFYENPTESIAEVEILKIINSDTGLNLKPDFLRIVTTLQNLDKKWKIDVYMIATPEPFEVQTSFKILECNSLDNTCHPTLKWLVPLCTDLSVYGSGFNQILMK